MERSVLRIENLSLRRYFVLYVFLQQSKAEYSKADRLNEAEPSGDSKSCLSFSHLQKFFRLDKVYIATSGLLCHTLPGSLHSFMQGCPCSLEMCRAHADCSFIFP